MVLKKVFLFYYDGFRNMREGKTLWLIIAIKLFVIFFIVRYFFYSAPVNHFKSDQQRANYYYKQLVR
jgi:hypothetical protein